MHIELVSEKKRKDLCAALLKAARELEGKQDEPVEIPDDRNVLREAIKKIAVSVNDCPVGVLKVVCAIPRYEVEAYKDDYRVWELRVLKMLKERFNPRRCVFQANDISSAEVAFLNSEKIESMTHAEPINEESAPEEVDIFCMANARPLMIDELLRSRNPEYLKKTLVIRWGAFTWAREPGDALRLMLKANFDCPDEMLITSFYERWWWQVYKMNFPEELPELPEDNKDEKTYDILPFYVTSLIVLLTATTLALLKSSIEIVQKVFEETGYLAEVIEKLSKLLNDRSLRRICLIGLGNFAWLWETGRNAMYQLAMALSIRSHFGTPEITSQELTANLFEKYYMEQLGIEVLEPTDLSEPEEGLEDDEVALFCMHHCTADLYNSVLWANRNQIKKIIIFGNGLQWPSKQTVLRPCATATWPFED
ncbi:hypothetical protein QR680_008296 [Steinernema hermaphroditum]|uniref:SRR1-like domain-containing protein n=1 Tax=Steinernema hermaphroditum TaxID=289476 RepID=A0AA39IHH1_9BILA|nr:hypothetical protein QR680_008296 [Steinernema hermaphroditum]